MESNASVVALGHAIVDVLARTDDRQVASLGLHKGTMALVDGTRAEDLYSAITPDAHASGGSAANTAACLASLGATVRFVGKVADDEMGKVFTEDIRAAGVQYDTRPGGAAGPATGRCLVLVTPDAEKTMCTDLGAGATIDPEDLHLEAISAARVLYMEGYLVGPPDTSATVDHAVEAARGAGTLVAFSASDPGWVELQRAALVGLLDRVDILFANEPEALGLSGQPDLEGAVGALLQQVPTVAVTLGSQGCLVATRDGSRVRVPAVPVERVVDSTGAGDSFAAGFLYGVVNDLGHEASARLGALAAGEIVSHLGARPLARLAELAVSAGLV
ncbi:MAG TPA: adenosine kinase [Acidimicrobiales bacterium]|nr:adenosine kinase [Acidimicrobiales bacterium]